MAASGSLVDRLDADVEGADVGATTSAIFPPLSRTIPLDMSISESTVNFERNSSRLTRGVSLSPRSLFSIFLVLNKGSIAGQPWHRIRASQDVVRIKAPDSPTRFCVTIREVRAKR